MLSEDTVRTAIDDWKYYNHAAIPTTAPHLEPSTEPIEDGSIWNIPGKPYMARWTTEFDCGYETEWWYCIKDAPFDIMDLPSKRRYEIKKGIKKFEVAKIDPEEYKEELLAVTAAAYAAYPIKYRPNIDAEQMEKRICGWKNSVVFGALQRENCRLCGYAVVLLHRGYAELIVQKADPAYEKYGLNAGILYGILDEFNEKLSDGYYICDGSRNISHETKFQAYLEKYFGFRKAYCRLNLCYAKKFAPLVRILYPFRNILCHFDGIRICHYVNSVLKMETIRRSFD